MKHEEKLINGWSISQGDYIHNGRYDKEADLKKIKKIYKQIIFACAGGACLIASIVTAIYLR